KFVKPHYLELIVLKGFDEGELIVLPEFAVNHEADAAERGPVLEIANAAESGAGGNALLGARPAIGLRDQRVRLRPPHVVILHPPADVDPEVLVGSVRDEAFPPARLERQVAADAEAFLFQLYSLGLLLVLLFLLLVSLFLCRFVPELLVNDLADGAH